MITGAWLTLRVKACVAFGPIPLLAVIVTLKGAPKVAGGVPLNIPVALYSVAQAGSPVALKTGAGVPDAVTVKLPLAPTAKVPFFGLVMTGPFTMTFTSSARLGVPIPLHWS